MVPVGPAAGSALLVDLEIAAVHLDDAVADGQAQPGALPLFLGGEEGLEDLLQVLRRDARAVVGHRDGHLAVPVGDSW